MMVLILVAMKMAKTLKLLKSIWVTKVTAQSPKN